MEFEDLEDKDFKECYSLALTAVKVLMDKQVDPLMIAGVLTTLGLSLYKTSLNDPDFDMMMETIMDMKEQIKYFNEPQEKETIH